MNSNEESLTLKKRYNRSKVEVNIEPITTTGKRQRKINSMYSDFEIDKVYLYKKNSF